MIKQKWHVEKRNVKIGDIVLIRDRNAIRGCWQLGQVTKIYPSNDNIVRQIEIRYKIPNNKRCSFIKRAVQSIVIILPVDENVTH